MLRTFIRMGVLRGVLRGSRPWMYLGATAWALHLLGRMAARKPVTLTEKLRPGERLGISHVKRQT